MTDPDRDGPPSPADLYAALVAGSPDAVLLVDEQGRYVDANPAACRLLGYARDELLGMRAIDLVAAGSARLEEMGARFRAEGQWRGELDLRRKDRILVPVEAWSVLVPGPDGPLRASFMRDVSDRRRAEEELREAKEGAEEAAGTLAILVELGRTLSAELELGRLVQAVTDAGVALTGARFGAFFHGADGERGGELRLYTLSGAPREAFERFPVPRATSLFGPTFRGEAPVRIDDVRADARYGRNLPCAGMPEGHLPVASYLAVPVVSRSGEVLGGLFFGHPEPAVFGQRAEDLAVGLAAHAAIAFENGRLYAGLQASEGRFRALTEHASDMTCIVDAAGVRLYASPTCERILGYRRDELVGRNVLEIVHRDDERAARAFIETLRQAPDIVDCRELRVVRRDDSVRWLEVVGHNRLADPDVAGIVLTSRDVTERKAAEDALTAERDLLDAVLAHLPDAVYVKDADSRFTRVNEAAAGFYGLTDPDDAVGRTDFEVFPAAIADGLFAAEQALLASGAPVLAELEHFPDHAGDERWMLATKVPLRDKDGRTVGLVGISRDVTEQKRGERALREQAEVLAAVVETQAEIAGARPDPEAVMRLVVERVRRLTGAEGAGIAVVEGESVVYRVVDGGSYQIEGIPFPLAGSLTGRCLETGEVQYSGDTEEDPRVNREQTRLAGVRSLLAAPLRHEGQVVGALGLSSPRPGAFGEREAKVVQLMGGQVAAALAHAEAYAALRKAKEMAEEASRLKSAFLSTMSHELRTPLNAIIGYAHLLLDGIAGALTDQQTGDVRNIADGADHLLALINDVLDLSRIEAGAMELSPAPVDLRRLLEQVRTEFAPEAAAKRLTLTVDAPDELVVSADPLRIRQILDNLVGNAVKFTDRGGVTVSATIADGGAEVSVVDTGVGIRDGDLEAIFEEFRQADSSASRRHGGTGLGLAIAKRLVELQGGTISVVSTPGAGSTFTVRLPLG